MGREVAYEVERLREIESTTLRDVNALIPQLKPSWKPLSEHDLAELLASDSLVYVARHGRRIVGLTLMVPHRHLPGLRYHVEDVVIASEHRGRGLGGRLLRFAMRDVPGRALSFDLRSHASRTHAHRLYASLGFRASDTTVFRLDLADERVTGIEPA